MTDVIRPGNLRWFWAGFAGYRDMQAALDTILRRFITRGRLRVRWPDGRFTSYAGPPDSGPAAGLAFNDRRTVRRLILNPEMALGEAYMDGGLIPVDCGIHDVLSLILANFAVNDGRHPVPLLRRIVAVARRLDQLNSYGRARRNVAHHYDLNGRLYSLFLDRDRQVPRALTSGMATSRWKRRRSRRSGTLRPSSVSTVPISRCWTSAAAGAGLR